MISASENEKDVVYDIVVIGGGVAGLAVLREAALSGWSCALVEKEEHLLSWASGSNSGIACTGVDAAPGTLERALIRDSISRLRIFCQEMNVPLRECGSLVCHWPWDEQDRLHQVLEESHLAGDSHARLLSSEEVRNLEPNLDPSCKGAVHIPGETVVDPWLYSIALGVHARQNGAHIFNNFEMDSASSSFDGEVWKISRVSQTDDAKTPQVLWTKAVVNATGLWSDIIQRETESRVQWEARPRRGQYRVYASPTETYLTHPIQPIPTQRTKGIFVFSSLYNQVIVGPTAEDQESKTDRTVDSRVSDELERLVHRILPGLDLDTAHVGDYVGIRPGTDQRDYQIHLDFKRRWVACAGIRSTGLTASLGIGRHVAYLLKQGILEGISRGSKSVRTVPLPDLDQLISEFHHRGDGCVSIDGQSYKVTHPITRFGWLARAGLVGSCKTSHP